MYDLPVMMISLLSQDPIRASDVINPKPTFLTYEGLPSSLDSLTRTFTVSKRLLTSYLPTLGRLPLV